MSISLTSAQEDEIASNEVRLGFFYEAKYSNDTVRAWTGYEDKSFDSDGDNSDETFLGVGEFASIGKIEEQKGVKASGFQVKLSGVPIDGSSDALDDALREDYHGKDAKLWLGLLNDSGDLVGDPILLNKGFQDKHEVNDSGDTLTITVNVENPMRNLRRKATLHYTSEDHQVDHPDDRFFDHVEDIIDKQESWGSNLQGKSSGGGGGGGGCFITTAVCEFEGKSDDCYELETLRDLRDNYMIKDPFGIILVRMYYDIAPMIVDMINQKENREEYYTWIKDRYIDPSIEYKEKGQIQKAIKTYTKMICDVVKVLMNQNES